MRFYSTYLVAEEAMIIIETMHTMSGQFCGQLLNVLTDIIEPMGQGAVVVPYLKEVQIEYLEEKRIKDIRK